jgi:hypothetical protein
MIRAFILCTSDAQRPEQAVRQSALVADRRSSFPTATALADDSDKVAHRDRSH